MAAPNMEEYTRTFSSFSGADIVATFNGRIIGELQAISYSVTREVAPIYTMGSPDPRSFSRGKRGIGGSMIFTMFDRDAFLDEMNKDYAGAPPAMKFQQFVMNEGQGEMALLNGLRATQGGYGITTWDEQMTKLGYGLAGGNAFNDGNLTNFYVPEYADQVMPFNVSITAANEFGQRAGMEIYGIQMLTEGSGFSVDDVVAAKAYQFVARKVKSMAPKDSLRSEGSSSYSGTNGDVLGLQA